MSKKELIGKYKGFEIYVKYNPAKQKGKDRLWLYVEQKKPTPWRIATTLSYVNKLHIRFERETSR